MVYLVAALLVFAGAAAIRVSLPPRRPRQVATDDDGPFATGSDGIR